MALEYMVACTGVHHSYQDAVDDLQRRVSLAVRDGWRPQGGVSAALSSYDSLVLAQALVKGTAEPG